MTRRERRSRVLEYFEEQKQEEQEPQEEADPFEGLDDSFGLGTSGKEQNSV